MKSRGSSLKLSFFAGFSFVYVVGPGGEVKSGNPMSVDDQFVGYLEARGT